MNHAGRCTDNTVTTWCRKSYSGSGVCHIMVPMHTSSHTRGVNLSRTPGGGLPYETDGDARRLA